MLTRFLYRNFWIQLIFGAVVQAIHFFMPESRSTILMDKRAKHLRKTGEDTNVYGPDEVKKPRISGHEVMITWIRPFEMFIKEPIVLSLSLLSGFSDALIFTFQEGFNPVYKQWGFGPNGVALAFLPILIGYIIAYVSYFPFIIKDKRVIAQKGPDALPPEHRLYWLLYLAPLETIGLFGFAWTSLGPEYGIPWIAPMIFSSCIAIANYAIYMSTIDYMVASYGVYSASASGGNGFARDFLAGIAALYATVSQPLHHFHRTSILTFDVAPLRERWSPEVQSRIRFDYSRLSCVRGHHTHLHLLLEGRMVPREVQVRPEPRRRQEGDEEQAAQQCEARAARTEQLVKAGADGTQTCDTRIDRRGNGILVIVRIDEVYFRTNILCSITREELLDLILDSNRARSVIKRCVFSTYIKIPIQLEPSATLYDTISARVISAQPDIGVVTCKP